MAGADALCPKARISGYYTPGTFGEYCVGPVKYDSLPIALLPSSVGADRFILCSYVTPIPDELESADAAVSDRLQRLCLF